MYSRTSERHRPDVLPTPPSFWFEIELRQLNTYYSHFNVAVFLDGDFMLVQVVPGQNSQSIHGGFGRFRQSSGGHRVSCLAVWGCHLRYPVDGPDDLPIRKTLVKILLNESCGMVLMREIAIMNSSGDGHYVRVMVPTLKQEQHETSRKDSLVSRMAVKPIHPPYWKRDSLLSSNRRCMDSVPISVFLAPVFGANSTLEYTLAFIRSDPSGINQHDSNL